MGRDVSVYANKRQRSPAGRPPVIGSARVLGCFNLVGGCFSTPVLGRRRSSVMSFGDWPLVVTGLAIALTAQVIVRLRRGPRQRSLSWWFPFLGVVPPA